MKRLRFLVCAFAVGTGGCSGTTQPHGAPSDVNGTWSEDFGGSLLPGNSFVMNLSDAGSVVTGNGNYAGEAGPFGLLAITGSAVTDSVHLSIAYLPNAIFTQLPPDTARFDGALTTRDRIDGVMVRAGAAHPFALVRLKIGDPP